MPAGRPTKYYPELCENMIEYFSGSFVDIDETIEEVESVEDGKLGKKGKKQKKIVKKKIGSQLPTFAGWCWSVKIHRDTMYQWIKENRQFSDTYRLCKEAQENMLVQNTLQGRYNAGFAHFLAKNLTNMRDDPEQEEEDVELEL